MDEDIARRIRLDRFIPAERAIYDAVQAVETLGADVRLTAAVVLLQQAREKVADFVDGVDASRDSADVAPSALTDDDIPLAIRRELMACAIQHGDLSYWWLCGVFRRGRDRSAGAPLQPHTDLQAKLDNALETYRTVAHALQADVIRLNDLRKAAVGCLHPEPQDPLTALQAGLVGQWRNEAVLVLNHSEIHERDGAAALRRCADELERAIQALRPPGEIATPAPPWHPMDTMPENGQVIVCWNDTPEYDTIGRAEYLECVGYGESPALGWMPLPPAPPQAPEQEPK